MPIQLWEKLDTRCESLNEEARGICKLQESCNNIYDYVKKKSKLIVEVYFIYNSTILFAYCK